MMAHRAVIFAFVLLALSVSGCKVFGGKPKTPPPPALKPTPALKPAPKPTPTPVVTPAAPPEPVAPPPIRPKPVQPAPTPAPVQTVPVPPAFGQILTPQQQADFRKSYQQSAQSARQALGQIAGRRLSIGRQTQCDRHTNERRHFGDGRQRR